MRSWIFALLFVFAPASAFAEADLPRVLVLATGGTIAGEQKDPGTQEGYEIRRMLPVPTSHRRFGYSLHGESTAFSESALTLPALLSRTVRLVSTRPRSFFTLS